MQTAVGAKLRIFGLRKGFATKILCAGKTTHEPAPLNLLYINVGFLGFETHGTIERVGGNARRARREHNCEPSELPCTLENVHDKKFSERTPAKAGINNHIFYPRFSANGRSIDAQACHSHNLPAARKQKQTACLRTCDSFEIALCEHGAFSVKLPQKAVYRRNILVAASRTSKISTLSMSCLLQNAVNLPQIGNSSAHRDLIGKS